MASFLAIGAVTLVVLVIATNVLAGKAANREALAELRSVNEVLTQSVGEPQVNARLSDEDRGVYDRLARVVQKRVQTEFLPRINIWQRRPARGPFLGR